MKGILSVCLQAAFLVDALQVSIPLTAPENSSRVSPSVVGLSLEQDRWLEWYALPFDLTCGHQLTERLHTMTT